MITQILFPNAARTNQIDALIIAQDEFEDYLEEQAGAFIAPSFQS